MDNSKRSLLKWTAPVIATVVLPAHAQTSSTTTVAPTTTQAVTTTPEQTTTTTTTTTTTPEPTTTPPLECNPQIEECPEGPV